MINLFKKDAIRTAKVNRRKRNKRRDDKKRKQEDRNL